MLIYSFVCFFSFVCSDAEVDVFLLVATFTVESMQTLLFVGTTFVLAHQSAAPHLGGTDRTGLTVTEAKKMEGYVIAEALVSYYRTTLINTTILLALLDSPFQIPVWLGRLLKVFALKAIDMLSDCCTACVGGCSGGDGAHVAEGTGDGRGRKKSADPFERASADWGAMTEPPLTPPSPPSAAAQVRCSCFCLL